MFFILSKIFGYLARPLVIIIAALVTSVFIKNRIWKKRLFYFGLALLLIFSNDFISNEVMHAWELPATPYAAITKKYKIGIVLTGVTKSNVSPADRIHFHRGADRVTHTLQLYRLGIIEKILISGGSGTVLVERAKEADELSDVFQLMGVPKEDLIIENQSDNTYQSAINVKAILEGKIKQENCLLITSAFHMRRARACFEKANFTMDTFTVDFLSQNRTFIPEVLIIPKLEAMLNWQVLFKEWAGMVAYKIAGYI
jgi:uncharacterized SAM-binding protein YcdF (DUF218 family)